jgi:hypothetical protein
MIQLGLDLGICASESELHAVLLMRFQACIYADQRGTEQR